MRKLTMTLAYVVASLLSAANATAGALEDGTTAYVHGDYSSALAVLRPLAERGGAMAQFLIGDMYSNGQGVPKDLGEAAKWFRKAAEQGQVNAQTILGLMYRDGDGVPKDYSEAVKWLRKAAQQGESDAQLSLAEIYANGKGVPKSLDDAAKWFRKAAQSRVRSKRSLSSAACTATATAWSKTMVKRQNGCGKQPNVVKPRGSSG